MDPQQLKELFFALKLELVRYKSWCLAGFIVICCLVLAVGYTWPQTYKTSATLYADQTNIIEPLLRGRAQVTDIDGAKSAKDIIYTRKFLEEVIEEANLLQPGASPELLEQKVKYLRGTIHIESVGKEYFKVLFASNNPDRTYDILVATIQSFISYTNRQKKEESYGAYKFIDSQVQAYKKQLEDAEDRLKVFKTKNVEGSEAAVTLRISNLRSEIESLNLSEEETISKIATLKKQLASESNFLQARSRLTVLEESKDQMLRNLEQLRLMYQESYPDIVSLKAQIAELDTQIDSVYEAEGVVGRSNNKGAENPLYEELRLQLSVAEVDLKAQTQRLKSLNRLLETGILRAEKVASNEAELSELTRDYDVTKNVYEEMLQRKESARLSMVLDIEGQGISYRIHEPAVYPLSSVGLKFIHFAVIAPLLALLVPIGLIVAYIMVDPRIRSTASLETGYGNLRLLGAVPYCYTSISTRILRRDALMLVGIFFLFILGYIAVVLNQLMVVE